VTGTVSTQIENSPLRSTRKIIESLQLDYSEYSTYRDKYLDYGAIYQPDKEITSTLDRLLSAGYGLALYTNCTQTQTDKTLKELSLDDKFEFYLTIKDAYRKPNTNGIIRICEHFDIKPENLISIGNDYEKDLEPIEKLGGNSILIESERDLKEACEIIMASG